MATKHLIIGAGKAALSALEEIRRVNSRDKVKLVSMENCPPYSPAGLVYLLSGKIMEAGLWIKDENYLRSLRSTLAGDKRVIQIVPEDKKVIYHDGSSENYDSLLIASGSEPVKPPIQGLEEAGFHNFRTLTDCRRLLRELADKRNVTILGAGMVGMKIAAALLERGFQVSIIEKDQKILPLYFDEEAEEYIRDIFEEHKVGLITGKAVTSVSRRDSRIRIALSDDSSLDTDIVINATGIKSRVSFLDGTGIGIRDGVLVNRRMSTGIEHIYAAGDVAEAPDFFKGEPKTNPIIPNAVMQGRVAGANMVGVDAEYKGGIPMTAFNFMGIQAFSIGLPLLQDNAGQVFKQNDHWKRRFKKLVFDGDILVGGMFLNEKIDPGIVLHLIKERINLVSHKDALLERGRPLSDPWLSSLKFSLPV